MEEGPAMGEDETEAVRYLIFQVRKRKTESTGRNDT